MIFLVAVTFVFPFACRRVKLRDVLCVLIHSNCDSRVTISHLISQPERASRRTAQKKTHETTTSLFQTSVRRKSGTYVRFTFAAGNLCSRVTIFFSRLPGGADGACVTAAR